MRVHPETRKLIYVSPSAVGTAIECMRKWWIESVEGRRSPATPGQAVGKVIHKGLEDYYVHGAELTHESSKLSLAHLPPRSPALHIEVPMGEQTVRHVPHGRKDAPREQWGQDLYLEGVPVVGFLDLFDPATATVWDHKSSKDKRWNKTPEQLGENFQMLTYLVQRRSFMPDASVGVVAHNYVGTKGKAWSMPVALRLGLDDVTERWHKYGSTVTAMGAAALKPTWQDVEPNTLHCTAYGGCPWLSTCFPEPKEVTEVDLTAMLKPSGTPAPKPATVTPSIVPPDAPSAVKTPASPLLVITDTYTDDLAARTLQTLLSNALVSKEADKVDATALAKQAYAIARAMSAERGK